MLKYFSKFKSQAVSDRAFAVKMWKVEPTEGHVTPPPERLMQMHLP